ncbi:uncharacterized protein [Magallana gigas]
MYIKHEMLIRCLFSVLEIVKMFKTIVIISLALMAAAAYTEHKSHNNHHLSSHHRNAHRELHVHLHVHQEEDHHHSSDHEQCHEAAAEHFAHCEVRPNSLLSDSVHQIHGSIKMSQKGHGPLTMKIGLSGFNVNAESNHKHGFHIHEFGDLSNGCDSVGEMYHVRDSGYHSHSGDLGDLFHDEYGYVNDTRSFDWISMDHHDGILGRSLVIYQGNHSSHTGALACCIIGRCHGH